MSKAARILLALVSVWGLSSVLSAGSYRNERAGPSPCAGCRAVYPLYGTKAGNRELLGAAVSIGDGWLLTASHVLDDHREPYRSMGRLRQPELSISTDADRAGPGRGARRLREVEVPALAGHDLALLRLADAPASRPLEVARSALSEPAERAAELSSEIDAGGSDAVFAGFGDPDLPYFGDGLARRTMATSIYGAAETRELMESGTFSFTQGGSGRPEVPEAFGTRQLLLTTGSESRYPVANDSGGGLFVVFRGVGFLVGIHTGVIHGGGDPPLVYGVFENLMESADIIADAIHRHHEDRRVGAQGDNDS